MYRLKLLKAILRFYDSVEPLVRKGIPIERVREMRVITEIMRLKERRGVEAIERVMGLITEQARALAEEYGVV